jgi:hypothetical protein
MILLRPYETTATGKVAVHERYPIEQAIELKATAPTGVDTSKSLLAACTGLGLPKQLVQQCIADANIEPDAKATDESLATVLKRCHMIVASLKALESPTEGFLFKKDGKNTEFSPILLLEHAGREDTEKFPSLNEA